MKTRDCRWFAAAFVLASATAAHAQPAQIPGWRLVWSEEFSGSAVNTAIWNAENIAWPHNSELEYYLPQQATVQNGLLNIKAERRNVGGRNYVSARINTRGHFVQQYGRFEARIRVPAGQGLWPAFWLLPATDAWPPEIDIMEHIGGVPNRIYMTHHWGTVSNVMSNGTTFVGPDYTAGFHNFAVEWSGARVDWYIDNILRFSTTANFPQEPMYIILNMAVGGTLPGNPNASTPFPSSMLVDWVRVYQRDVPLANPGFEDTGTNGALAGWSTFGNTQQSTTTVRSGNDSVRAFGIAGNGPFYSGVYQDFLASPGQVWQAGVHLRHNSSSPLTGSNFVDLKIEWYGPTGASLGTSPVQTFASTSPRDTWIPLSIQGTAPAGTSRARVAVVFAQPGTGTGSAYFDDATFSFLTPGAIAPCTADYNGAGGLSVQDIFDFLAAYFQNDPRADFNNSGGITVQDIFDFLAEYFAGC